jgi:hypothetical protein
LLLLFVPDVESVGRNRIVDVDAVLIRGVSVGEFIEVVTDDNDEVELDKKGEDDNLRHRVDGRRKREEKFVGRGFNSPDACRKKRHSDLRSQIRACRT